MPAQDDELGPPTDRKGEERPLEPPLESQVRPAGPALPAPALVRRLLDVVVDPAVEVLRAPVHVPVQALRVVQVAGRRHGPIPLSVLVMRRTQGDRPGDDLPAPLSSLPSPASAEAPRPPALDGSALTSSFPG